MTLNKIAKRVALSSLKMLESSRSVSLIHTQETVKEFETRTTGTGNTKCIPFPFQPKKSTRKRVIVINPSAKIEILPKSVDDLSEATKTLHRETFENIIKKDLKSPEEIQLINHLVSKEEVEKTLNIDGNLLHYAATKYDLELSELFFRIYLKSNIINDKMVERNSYGNTFAHILVEALYESNDEEWSRKCLKFIDYCLERSPFLAKISNNEDEKLCEILEIYKQMAIPVSNQITRIINHAYNLESFLT